MDGEARELELKFQLGPSQGPDILAWLGQGRQASRQSLTAVYFDTAAQDLRRAGFVLRVRGDDGEWTQTVKSDATPDGRPGRGEWETRLPGPLPDLAAARRTPAGKALGRGARLKPMFAVNMDRRALEIRASGAVIEACLDSGTVQAGGRKVAVQELELELKSGSTRALLSLARRLARAWPVDPSVVTKADRGFALVEGQALEPRRFRAPRLTAAMTAGDAFRSIARAEAEQIVWNAELLRAGPIAEAVHQTRVGTRRLRATLTTFKAVVADRRLAGLKARLKWLSRELDPARNLDVLIEAIRCQAAPGGGATEPPSELLAAQGEAHDRARAAVGGQAFRDLILDLAAWLETGPWTLKGAKSARRRDQPILDFAAAAIEKGHRRLLKAGADMARLEPADLHLLRIRTKGLRYAVDVLHPLFDRTPKRTRRFLAALEVLVDALGDLNDIATAGTLTAGLEGGRAITDRESGRARDLLKTAETAFEAARDAQPKWRTKT